MISNLVRKFKKVGNEVVEKTTVKKASIEDLNVFKLQEKIATLEAEKAEYEAAFVKLDAEFSATTNSNPTPATPAKPVVVPTASTATNTTPVKPVVVPTASAKVEKPQYPKSDAERHATYLRNMEERLRKEGVDEATIQEKVKANTDYSLLEPTVNNSNRKLSFQDLAKLNSADVRMNPRKFGAGEVYFIPTQNYYIAWENNGRAYIKQVITNGQERGADILAVSGQVGENYPNAITTYAKKDTRDLTRAEVDAILAAKPKFEDLCRTYVRVGNAEMIELPLATAKTIW